MKKIVFISIIISLTLSNLAQDLNNVQLPHMRKQLVRKAINIPDILGYKTLKCDFHMHTVFSDGIVWPTFRVDEAWEEGLDAIAITDHIENQPSKKYVGGDHNASYEIALPRANEKDIILIRAGEITREMPPGHLNGLFLKDVNPLDTPHVKDAIKAATDQGGFILWNHPGWKAQQPDTCLWMEMHQELFDAGMIHGIEVFNEKEWYPIALDWCLDKEIAVIGNSDIHDVNAHYYDVENGHRPMTLVFATDRSEQAIKEAMFAKRTVAWFDDKLAGKEEFLKEIFRKSVSFKDTGKERKGKKLILAKNISDIPFILSNGDQGFTIPKQSEIIVHLKGKHSSYMVLNLYTGSDKNPTINIK